jgi:hypothetical protein
VAKRKRRRYSAWQKEQIREHYAGLRNHADRRRFCTQIGITDENGEPSVDRLYNVACRLRVSGKRDFSNILDDDGRLLRRDDPETTQFSHACDNYLRREYGRTPIEVIAAHLDLSETAVGYRARILGLRNPNWAWDAAKVAVWLGLSLDELHAAREQGLVLHELRDRRGKCASEFVTASSLGRLLQRPEIAKLLVERGADAFFIRDLNESLAQLASGEQALPKCRYLLCGDVCGQPQTVSFGHFCTRSGKQDAGDDRKCNARYAEIAALGRPEDDLFGR